MMIGVEIGSEDCVEVDGAALAISSDSGQSINFGASLEDIRKRATEKSSVRTAAREAALKEMKAKKATTKKGGKSKAKTFEKVPKHMARR